MRPLLLNISAFGPYAGEVSVPMEELGEQGLYLITGDTGAGKTTIFDAICFALFGEPSGQNREPSMFRSKYAKDSVATYVELTFLHKGQEYYIRRNPEYMRPAKRGTGMQKELPAAELRYPDGRVVSKVREVNIAIQELLGVDRKQFSQIAMLAQGDFLELLLADTKKRGEIFRELFHTGFYQQLQARLEEERKKVYGLCEDAKKSVAQYVMNLSCDEASAYGVLLTDAREGRMLTEDVVTLIGSIVAEDEKQVASLTGELTGIEKAISEVDRQLGKAEELEKTKAEYARVKEQYALAAKREQTLLEAREEAKLALGERETFVKQIAEIEQTLPDYDKLEELLENRRHDKQLVKTLEADISKLEDENNRRYQTIESCKEELTSLKDAGMQKEKLLSQKQLLTAKQETLVKLNEEAGAHAQKEAELDKRKARYRSDEALFQQKNSRYEALDHAYREGQAYILSRDLQEGLPCPVCGSTTHPRPADSIEEVPTQQALEDAKRAAEDARRQATESSKAAGECARVLEAMTERLLRELKAELGVMTLSGMQDVLNQHLEQNRMRLEELSERILAEEARAARGEEIARRLPKSEEKWEQTREEIVQKREKTASLYTRIEAYETQRAEIQRDLAYGSKAEAAGVRQSLLKKSESLQRYYEQVQAEHAEKQKELQELSGVIKTCEKTLGQAETFDITQLRSQRLALDAQKEQCQRKQQSIVSRKSANELARERITEQMGALSETERRLQWMTSLSYTANGKLAGKEKVMLETYIQMTYFERIIARANLRLLKMSDAQYELKRTQQASNNRGQSGLELSVIDHYNGSERSVKTLSGGESFMASLSLALGLSDEVQSMAGGIRVDTMFVDEGFGTLDPETLQSAYHALASLTEGNRLVGIISHVEELKTKIEKQIIVKKEKSGGSYVTMQV